jgi:hypothetical protein
MYHVYVIDESAFDPKKAIGDFGNLDDARKRLKREFAKNADTKYVIEETTGHVNSYGDLVAEVIEEN